MSITLDDIEIGTLFTHCKDLNKYEKGSSGTYGEHGFTICYPLRGGKIQRKEKFKIKILNNEGVSLI